MTFRRILMAAVLAAASCLALAGCVQNKDADGDGNKEVVISSECSWYGGVECEASCDEFDFWASCEGEFDIDCDPHCDEFEVTAECTGSCEADCSTECTDLGSFDCEAYCNTDCSANCEAECEASAGDGEAQAACSGHCGAYCEGKCGASCDIELPDCDTACSASCEGECDAEVNIDCHLCDAEVYVDCNVDMNLQCEGGCDTEGALECNGEFISSDDLQTAIDWVEANMTAEVTYEGSADCHGNTCEAEASASIECDAAAPGRQDGGGLLALISSLFFQE
jgi:hypothetical protein